MYAKWNNHSSRKLITAIITIKVVVMELSNEVQ